MDMKKELKDLYAPSSKQVSFVNVPPMPYIMMDGQGDPNTAEAYASAISALYTVAYAIRGISKANGQVFTVMPLEGLWWWHDMDNRAANFVLSRQDKSDFLWTLMIVQPPHITQAIFEEAKKAALQKKLPAIETVCFATYHEGDAAQILHVGSYDTEGENIQKLHDNIHAAGYQLSGKHHEIYLSDPRKVVPEKLKTIIRQPFSR
jgi:hypothetical protein